LPPRESATPRHPDPRGPISLADSFFDPVLLTNSHDLNVILKGLASQKAEEIDNKIVDAVRNFLFGPPGAGGFDLASLNIQRGRDHGLSDYNTTRDAFGLPPGDFIRADHLERGRAE
jgi:peroxidase